MTLSLAYVVMALGLNIVVGYAGLLDLGYVAFFAFGAYCTGWFMSGFFANADVHVGVSKFAEDAVTELELARSTAVRSTVNSGTAASSSCRSTTPSRRAVAPMQKCTPWPKPRWRGAPRSMRGTRRGRRRTRARRGSPRSTAGCTRWPAVIGWPAITASRTNVRPTNWRTVWWRTISSLAP